MTPASASSGVKGTQQFLAVGNYSDGSTRDLTASVKWTSSNNGVATVHRGLAKGVAKGKVTITASLKGNKSSATLAVTL